MYRSWNFHESEYYFCGFIGYFWVPINRTMHCHKPTECGLTTVTLNLQTSPTDPLRKLSHNINAIYLLQSRNKQNSGRNITMHSGTIHQNKRGILTLICVAPCIFVIIVNFVANKSTLFILFLCVTLQVCRHVSIRVDHHRGISCIEHFQVIILYI
jgi:hypothetical protein